MTYKIIRFFKDENQPEKIVYEGLSLEEAQEHCQREDSHKKDDKGEVIWFEGYKKE